MIQLPRNDIARRMLESANNHHTMKVLDALAEALDRYETTADLLAATPKRVLADVRDIVRGTKAIIIENEKLSSRKESTDGKLQD